MQAWIGAAVLQESGQGRTQEQEPKMRRVRERGLEWRDDRRQSKKRTASYWPQIAVVDAIGSWQRTARRAES
jgi:hypothetical protein